MSNEIKRQDLEKPAKDSIIIPIPTTSSQLKTIISQNMEESHISIDNRIDFSKSNYSSTTKSEKSSIESGQTKEFKNIQFNSDLYEGSVVLNDLHGHGFFSTQNNGQKIFYDGLFYINKLESYCQIFYENGTNFQGLFKQQKRYGPGILTYPNGSQDVGFWNGFQLARLACAVGSDTVPSLVNTLSGKTKLLSYRSLVPLCEQNGDLVKEVLKKIGSSHEVLEQSDCMLNLSIRNPNSLFFHKKFFDNHFFGGEDCTIKVAVDEQDTEVSGIEKKVNELNKGDDRNRIKNLKAKIKEIDESLQPFFAIKQDLLEKICYCNKCCAEKHETAEKLEKVEDDPNDMFKGDVDSKVFSARDTSIFESGSIMPDNFSEDSVQVSDIILQQVHVDNSLQQKVSLTPSKHTIIEYCTCGEQREVDDLQFVEEQLSNIIKQETFYRNIRNNLQKKLNKLLDQIEKNQDNPQPIFKLVEVTELWAWNNEELIMQIQKHSFKHRNFENMVNFNVADLIFGKRKEFGEIGEYEEICHKFLLACSKGKKDFVRRCLRENINPNLTDARGNSGIFFAAAKHQIEIISILTNFGAKLDQINDEELTPLSLCLLKYLSQKNGCACWEKAFLPETQIYKLPNLPKWYEIQSFLSRSSIFSRHSDSLGQQNSQNDYSNSRIVELFRRLSNFQQKTSSFIRSVPNTSYVFDLSYKNSENIKNQDEDTNNEDFQNELRTIHLTIMTLLDYGADPNVAKVPYPSLVLSLFTGNPDLVRQILKAKAEVNVLVTVDNISCLHVITSLNSSQNNAIICRLLLLYHCDPNIKTMPSHWKYIQPYFTGNIPEDFNFEDSGKNALHLICMRKDFENNNYDSVALTIRFLIKGGINYNETYLGHTPLSLAVLVGNVWLAKYLIKLNIFNPYENLAYEMGNILTLFTLKRFQNILPTDKCKTMLTALFESNVNVLENVGDAENAVDFAERGDFFFNLKTFEKDERKLVKARAKPVPAIKKNIKHSQSILLTEFLKDLGRETIIKQIQVIATEILYDLIEENILEDKEIAIFLAEFLTPNVVISNLEVLFQSNRIDFERLNPENIRKLLDFVNLHKKIVKAKKRALVSKNAKEKKDEDFSDSASTDAIIEEFIAKANFKKSAFTPRSHRYVVKPGLDDPKLYSVCFHCLKGKGKVLKICPRCQMVRFCSTQCNKLNMKVRTLHNCNIVYYDITDEQIQEITNGVYLLDLAEETKKTNLNRLLKKRETRLLSEELKLLEMWRADTYGTKFIEFIRLFHQTTKNRTSKGLMSWNLDKLQKLMERNFQKNPADFNSYSIEALLFKLDMKQKMQEAGSQGSKKSKSPRSSLGYGLGSRLGSRLGSILTERLAEKQEETNPICKCPEIIKHMKHKRRDESGGQKKHDSHQAKQLEAQKAQYVKDSLPGQFEDLYIDASVRQDIKITKKLKKIPEKYQRFIEVMGTYFPEIDLSFWLLPYACYSNGQLFYKFCDNDMFRQSYSFS